jgi:hypothetical protein
METLCLGDEGEVVKQSWYLFVMPGEDCVTHAHRQKRSPQKGPPLDWLHKIESRRIHWQIIAMSKEHLFRGRSNYHQFESYRL